MFLPFLSASFFFPPVFLIAFHLLPQGLPLGNTLKITIGPFVPTLGFSESVGWWVSQHCQIFCPVEMASQMKPAKYPRWQDQRWPRPVPLASRTFGRFSVCLTDCLSYIGLTFSFCYSRHLTSLLLLLSPHLISAICPSFHFPCSAHPSSISRTLLPPLLSTYNHLCNTCMFLILHACLIHLDYKL